MSPEKLLEVAQRMEAQIYPEFNTTTDRKRWRFLNDQLDRCAFLRCCSWLKSRGQQVPSVRRR